MDKNSLNISSIESFLYETLFSLSKNIYVGTLPNTLDKNLNEMVLIDCANGVADLRAFGRGTVLIWLYSKPMSNGIKNVKVLSKLEQKLNEIIEKSYNTDYRISRRNTFPDFDETLKWHCNIVELNITIF